MRGQLRPRNTVPLEILSIRSLLAPMYKTDPFRNVGARARERVRTESGGGTRVRARRSVIHSRFIEGIACYQSFSPPVKIATRRLLSHRPGTLGTRHTWTRASFRTSTRYSVCLKQFVATVFKRLFGVNARGYEASCIESRPRPFQSEAQVRFARATRDSGGKIARLPGSVTKSEGKDPRVGFIGRANSQCRGQF